MEEENTSPLGSIKPEMKTEREDSTLLDGASFLDAGLSSETNNEVQRDSMHDYYLGGTSVMEKGCDEDDMKGPTNRSLTVVVEEEETDREDNDPMEAALYVVQSSEGHECQIVCCSVEDVQLVRMPNREGSISDGKVIVRFGPYEGKLSELHAESLISCKGFAMCVMKEADFQVMYGFEVKKYPQSDPRPHSNSEIVFELRDDVYSLSYQQFSRDNKWRTNFGLAEEIICLLFKQLNIPVFKKSAKLGQAKRIANNSERNVISYVCKVCDKNCVTSARLNRHMRVHSYVCEVCDKNCVTSARLNRHMRVHSGEKPYQCKVCSKAFADQHGLKYHQIAKHCVVGEEPEKPYVCEVCSKRFLVEANLKVHMRVHAGEKPYQCKVCSKSFARSHGLEYHKKRKHSAIGQEPKKSFVCEVCSKSFTMKASLKVHLRIHTGDKPYQCEVCSETFAYSNALKFHQIRKHSSHKLFTCKVCCLQFLSEEGLQKHHLNKHADGKSYDCEVCGKTFVSQPRLNVHMRVHTGEKPYKCVVCFKQFAYLCRLREHEREHTSENLDATPSERPDSLNNFAVAGNSSLSCEYCAKSFSSQANLKAHMQIHTAARKFSCTECGASFNHKSNLKYHQRKHGATVYYCRMHRRKFLTAKGFEFHRKKEGCGDSPLLCELCGKSYVTIEHLEGHIRKDHKGEKPFKCNYCLQTCVSRHSLQAHIRRCHDAKVPHNSCETCQRTFADSDLLQKHKILCEFVASQE